MTAAVDSYETGGRIEVWNQFLGNWAGDFEIASVADTGYRVRRTSDDEVLPLEFPAEDIRPLL